ncbi:MAG: hypothetical protein FP816_01945 [Desulfobacteraceae bacterium]|nr:hypothetical protein [Desulfobacteraceae bacterium]
MEGNTKTVKNISIKFLVHLFAILGFLLAAPHAKGLENHFKIEPARKISSEDMNCNYQVEDFGRYCYNFEYPKLIIMNDSEPLVAFIDEQSNQLIISKISDKASHVIYSASGFGKLFWDKWPIVYTKDKIIYLSVYSGNSSPDKIKRIKFYQIDAESGKVNQDQLTFEADGRCSLWSIFPYKEQYLFIGNCNYICKKQLASVLLGGNPTYYQNALFFLDEKQKLIRNPIEEKGCHNVFKQEYEIDDSDGIHAVWVKEEEGFGRGQNIIHYSSSLEGRVWSNPLEVYSVSLEDSTDYNQLYISLAVSGDSAFVLWQDRKKGISLSEIDRFGKVETVKISDKKEAKFNPMAVASTIKVASDKSGNVYVLWAQSFSKEYKLYFKARIDGKWSSEMIVNQGSGRLKLPDMKVDEKGKVHIAYIKSIDPEEPNGKYGCFYMSMSP